MSTHTQTPKVDVCTHIYGSYTIEKAMIQAIVAHIWF